MSIEIKMPEMDEIELAAKAFTGHMGEVRDQQLFTFGFISCAKFLLSEKLIEEEFGKSKGLNEPWQDKKI